MARLQDSRRVTLDSSGMGIIRFGPGRPNEVWTVEQVSCRVSTQTLEAQFKLYRGSIGLASFISGSVSGSTGDTNDTVNQRLNAGEYLTGQWTGGDVGAEAVMSFWGEIS